MKSATSQHNTRPVSVTDLWWKQIDEADAVELRRTALHAVIFGNKVWLGQDEMALLTGREDVVFERDFPPPVPDCDDWDLKWDAAEAVAWLNRISCQGGKS